MVMLVSYVPEQSTLRKWIVDSRKWPCGTSWPLVDIVGLAVALAGDLVYPFVSHPSPLSLFSILLWF